MKENEVKTLLGQIKYDQRKARKEKDKFKAGILTALMGEVSKVGIDNGHRDTNDAEAIIVITKFLKNLKEMFKVYTMGIELEDFFKVNDMETPTSEEKMVRIMNMKKEADIYKSYLPTQLSKTDIIYHIGLFLGDNADANMGQVMGYFKKYFGGQYNGKELSVLVKGLL